MFDRLLESRSRNQRFSGGTLASVTAHTAIIALAVLATAQARVQTPMSPDMVHPIYFPPTPTAPNNRTSSERESRVEGWLPAPIETRRIDLNLPPVDVGSTPMLPIDLPSSLGDAQGERRQGSGLDPNAPFQADQVEKQVAFISGSASPRYPDVLRSSGVEGQVVALFVVDESGRAEIDSVRFLRSDNRLFEDAVRAVLPRMRFVAAEIGGRKVRQLVQMPFVFTIDR